jgi:hypothetical protein
LVFVYRINGGSWIYINNQSVGNKPSTFQNYITYGTSAAVGDVIDFGVLNLSNSNVRFGLGNNSGTYTGYCGLSSFYTYTIVSGSNNTYINIQNTGSGYVIC